MKYIGTYILGRLAPRLVFLHSWIPDTFARVVCNNMWRILELIGKTCTAALTQPVCNPRSAMQCNGLNCMYVHLQWFTVWNKLGRPALLNLTFFETLNISTTHKWTNGYVIQMQMQKLQILTLAIPRANKGNASTWRGHILSAETASLVSTPARA